MPYNGNMMECIEVTGMVQGVGFRPFVYNLAKTGSLGGYITNTPNGVTIGIEGKKEAIDTFVKDLRFQAPPLSKIVSIDRSVIRHDPETENKKKYHDFEIRESVRAGHPETLIPPEAGTCDECIRELFDTRNRRYLYPFINCTNCGPRFTIMKELPYDRPFTTMAGFTMCPDCLSEYSNPGNRRFHAQPNACPVCGPRLELVNGRGKSIAGDPVVTAIDYLRQGKIVAVKGLGGFHLAVDGTNNKAVERLRRRKSREEKPLALMAGSLSEAEKLISMGLTEERILNSCERPIVLARRNEDNRSIPHIADSVAPGIGYLGVMLPYTPLHYLLFYHPEAGGSFTSDIPVFHALVMTSGNKSEEPVCKDNDEALARLGKIADAFLIHNRDIFVRCDDSVVRCYDTEVSFIRRSRGFVPSPVFLPERAIPVLAFGGELKNTLCIVNGNNAFMSQHIGDLENIPTLGFFHEAAAHFMKILDLRPHFFAYDLHPDYLSTKYVMKMTGELDKNQYGAVGVQHHHAHIAGVLAEHGNRGPVIGLSMDGSGYGTDGTVWGGEMLVCTPHSFTRPAHLDYVPLPGGTSAVRNPWRMAFSYLREAFGEDWQSLDLECLKQTSAENLTILDRACKIGLNCPLTSSLGRLFDAAASILDICHVTAFEGQAAMMLEMAATGESDMQVLPFNLLRTDSEQVRGLPELWGTARREYMFDSPDSHNMTIDYRPLVRALVEGVRKCVPKSVLALSFHRAILESLTETAELIREDTGISTAALSGGCWQNRLLSLGMKSMLENSGFTVLTHNLVPPNDGGLALGQAFIASCVGRL